MKTQVETAIESANQGFYDALESGSAEKMERVWLQEDWVRCVHPGRDAITGWKNIRDTWRNIFVSEQKMRISPADVDIRVFGGFAWVSCTENITVFEDSSFDSLQTVATNLFIAKDGDWMMVHHHASPIPLLIPDASSDTIQ